MIELILSILIIWVLIKVICFIFKLTWNVTKVIGVVLAIVAALSLISYLL